MEIYSSEDQQVDAIKSFIKDYGIAIVAGAVIGLAGLFAWNHFSHAKKDNAENASIAYQQLLEKDLSATAMTAAISKFDDEHSQKGYQALLNLMEAKKAVDAEDFTLAAASLAKVIQAKPAQELVNIAKLRLARVQMQEHSFDKALATLADLTSPAFVAQRDELKGDIFVHQGQQQQAKDAYQAAKDAMLVSGQGVSQGLQMKLDNLASA